MPSINHNYEAWSHPNCVSFYSNSRTKPEELYPSESELLIPILKRVRTVLDVGCAVGGFYSIMRALNLKIEYVGVDTASNMIKAAKAKYPEGDFRKIDGGCLPFKDNSFDLVLCTGVLNHVPEYKPMIADLYRVAAQYAVIDLPRITQEALGKTFELEKNNMVLKNRFPSQADGLDEEATRVPYALARFDEAYTFLLNELKPSFAALGSVGYYGKTNKSVTLPTASVCFNVIMLKKGKPGQGKAVAYLSLPEELKTSLKNIANSRNLTYKSSIDELLGR